MGRRYVSQCIKSIVARQLWNYISSFKHEINFAPTSSSAKEKKSYNIHGLNKERFQNSKYISKPTRILHYALIKCTDDYTRDNNSNTLENRNPIIESVDSMSRDERDSPLMQYITNAGISRARYTITHFKHYHRVVSSDARLHVNPLHFLARSAVC